MQKDSEVREKLEFTTLNWVCEENKNDLKEGEFARNLCTWNYLLSLNALAETGI